MPNTKDKRSPLSLPTIKYIYAKSAGRCYICYKYIIMETDSVEPYSIAELAHNIGATNDAKSPRSDSSIPAKEKSLPENLLLLCKDCHKQIDSEEEKWTIEKLKNLKATFEERIKRATNFSALRKSLVISIRSDLRDIPNNHATPTQIMEAMSHQNLEIEEYSKRHDFLDISLTDKNWIEGKKEIDEAIRDYQKLSLDPNFESTSIFGVAPIPYLFYLGFKLKNRRTIIPFPLNSGKWGWHHGNLKGLQSYYMDSFEIPFETKELNLIVNVGWKLNSMHLPDSLKSLPTISISANEIDGNMEKIESIDALNDFAIKWAESLRKIHESFQHLEKINLFAAVPTTIAIIMGQNYMDNTYAKLAVFHKEDNNFTLGLEVGK